MSKTKFTSKLKELHQEYLELKEKTFNGAMFVIAQNNEDSKRYDQLFQFFNPSFRTKSFINPLN